MYSDSKNNDNVSTLKSKIARKTTNNKKQCYDNRDHEFLSSLRGSIHNSQNTVSQNSFYWNVVDQVKDIVTGNYPHGIIRISKQQAVNRGYDSWKTFKNEWLINVFLHVERITGIDTEEIEMRMKDRFLFVEGGNDVIQVQ